MRSNIHLKNEAIFLRKAGNSYSQILKKLGLKSKGTLSQWFRDIVLSEAEEEKLEKNKRLAVERGLMKFNKNRSESILKENELFRKKGSNAIKQISKRELMIVGASLYWGEGTKAENICSDKIVSFTNSDPTMIAVFLKFARKILNVSEEKIRAGIHIYPNIDPNEARDYWSKITGLPSSKFYIVNQVSRSSKGKRPFNSLQYGTVVIKINDRKLFFYIKGMIKGIVDSFV